MISNQDFILSFIFGCLSGILFLMIARSYVKGELDEEFHENVFYDALFIIFSGLACSVAVWHFGGIQRNNPSNQQSGLVFLLSSNAHLVKATILSSLLITLAYVNSYTGKLPNKIVFPGMIIGFILAFSVFPEGPDKWNQISILARYKESIFGLLACGGSLLLAASLYQAIFRGGGVGGGDIKTFAMIGIFVGYKIFLVLLIIFLIMMISIKSFSPLTKTGFAHLVSGLIVMLYGKTITFFALSAIKHLF